jgi:regulatory protein
MTARHDPKPLDEDALHRLAIHYVGRYATTRAKLASYLRRKLKERGWADANEPDVAGLVARCADAGYVDDAAFAEARSVALTRRGYGARRIGQALAGAGIERALVSSLAHDEQAAFAAAEALARRRRFGPFSSGAVDEVAQRRAFAAMLRAGHSFALARRFSTWADDDPGRA